MVFYNDEYYEFIPKDGKLIITTLEDPDDPDYAAILRLYNAGILTGVDLRGSFAPDAPFTREQMAAVVTRVVDPALRKQIAP